MRRGHPSIGGWRNENPRHFRPRGGGVPHFRPSRNYSPQDTPRFPTPGLRPPRPSFNNQTLLNTPSEHHDRNKYRHESRQVNQFRHQDRSQNQRQIFPLLERMRLNKDHGKHFSENYFDNKRSEPYHTNSMGDVDHRQLNLPNNPESFNCHPTTSWGNPPDHKRQYYDDRNDHSTYRHHEMEGNRVPALDYTGHRPPASDHYGSSTGSTIDNSNSFSRSVDDTVDIIRKRLQNRNEALPTREAIVDHHDIDDRIPNQSNCQSVPQPQPVTKKRIQRQKQNESNCDKMKNKIVHELFKMDKDKIHKLMDNPSSSSKFEYALNTLITESQNSLNRHLRSVAEKSLCSSEDFVHNDNNTIYEDTFMKQMQGILDPQDTVLLEDIKPLVLAELSKVLQLDDYEPPFSLAEDQNMYSGINDPQNYENYESYGYENYAHEEYFEPITSPQPDQENFEHTETISDNNSSLEYSEVQTPKPLFERRPPRNNCNENPEKNFSSESRRYSRSNADTSSVREEFPFPNERRPSHISVDNNLNEEKNKEREQLLPLFDTNTEQLSDDEDPFAELDRQYHVAVDHNFIDYNISSPVQTTSNDAKPNSTKKEGTKRLPTPTQTVNIKKEIDDQIFNIAKSPLKLPSNNVKEAEYKSPKTSNAVVKQEITTPQKDTTDGSNQNIPNVYVKLEKNVDISNVNIPIDRPENLDSAAKSILALNTRKRSVDQKPSHRKEKRKKSETSPIANISENKLKPGKSKETAKSIVNLFLSKKEGSSEAPKNTNKVESVDKSYSDKYVKRKETQRTSNETEAEHKKRQRSISSSHSIVSPKEKDSLNNNTSSNKPEPKNKLQTIDMFVEQPRKTVHQAHRNTAPSPNTPVKISENIKVKQPVVAFNKKLVRRHVSTQVCGKKMHAKETQTLGNKNFTSRFCQTERKKTITRGAQTDPVTFKKPESKATDAFERMKEIDLEIQVLLQEKFKLYNSLESNDSSYPMQSSTIQSLGMTVLNVTPTNDEKENEANDDNSLAGDMIVENFTNIPVEELEQIALESVEDSTDKRQERRRRQQRVLEDERASSFSPVTRRTLKKAKTPNISLLEQIITDDRPIEDIISLDDLETAPVKSRKKKPTRTQQMPKKKNNKKARTVKSHVSLTDVVLKECCVVLTREDLTKYLKPKPEEKSETDKSVEPEPVEIVIDTEVPSHEDLSEVVVESIVNDLQLDMLDVSEDIVVGDSCEIKSEDKDTERSEIIISEEIILDNSQCSEPAQSDVNVGENLCKMYDYSTDENLRRDSITVTGHADAVLAIECIDKNFLAACLDGNVYYFSGDGQLITTLRGSNLAVTCLTIVEEKYGTTVYTGSLDSRIRYYDLETGLEKGPECNVLSPIQTMDRAWDTIFVGTRTGFVLQFECKNNMLIPVSTVKFSDQSILALRAMKEGPRKVLLVAARSEDVTIKDAQTGLLLRTLQGPKMTVYSLLYEDGKIYCGTSTHQIHVFDYASGTHVGTHEGGKGAVCLRATGGLVFAGCYDGCVYIYREGEPRPLAQLRGPGLMLLSLAVVGSKLIAGYKDRGLYIWKIPLSISEEMIL